MLSSQLIRSTARNARFTCTVIPQQAARPFFSSFSGTGTTDDNNNNDNAGDDDDDDDDDATYNPEDTVTRRHLINIMADEHAMTKAQANRILITILDTIVESVSEKKNVSISKFGAFQSIATKERQGRNPSTGVPLTIAKSHRIRFKPFQAFKTSVKGV